MTMSRLELLSKYEVPVSQSVCHNEVFKGQFGFSHVKIQQRTERLSDFSSSRAIAYVCVPHIQGITV